MKTRPGWSDLHRSLWVFLGVVLVVSQPASGYAETLQPPMEPTILEVHTLRARVDWSTPPPLTVSFELTLSGDQGDQRRSTHRLRLDGDFVERTHRVYKEHGDNILSAVTAALARRHPPLTEVQSNALQTAQEQLRAAKASRFFVTLSDVRLTPAVTARINRLGRAFFDQRGWLFVVTSGVRTPASQAEALYVKLRLGDNLVRLYADDRAARAIQNAYRSARKARLGRTETIAAMSRVISDQVARGVYLSNHLKAGAVDIRSYGMTRVDRKAFKEACRGVGVRKFMLEQRPPHWHLELRGITSEVSAQPVGPTDE